MSTISMCGHDDELKHISSTKFTYEVENQLNRGNLLAKEGFEFLK